MIKERQKVLAAARDNQPVVLMGPHGSGKTRLIKETLTDHPGMLYVGWQDTPHLLLVAIARALIASGHAEFGRRARFGAQPEIWLSGQTSSHLKALIWNAVEHTPVALIIDGVNRASFPIYRFLQRLYYTPGAWLSAAACDSAGLGALGRLFWDRRQIVQIAPLSERASTELFEAAADHFRLRGLELDEFREKVLDSAGGNPGQIIEMCRLAAQPQYVSGRSIKFTPLRIDAVMKFI